MNAPVINRQPITRTERLMKSGASVPFYVFRYKSDGTVDVVDSFGTDTTHGALFANELRHSLLKDGYKVAGGSVL